MASVNETPLWALIRKAKEQHELSYRDIATRSGGKLSRTALDKYRVGKVKQLAPETLRAISDVFHIPLPLLVEAALTTIGLDPGRSRTIEDAIRTDETLDEVTKRQLLRIIEDRRRQESAEKLAARPGEIMKSPDLGAQETAGEENQDPGGTP